MSPNLLRALSQRRWALDVVCHDGTRLRGHYFAVRILARSGGGPL